MCTRHTRRAIFLHTIWHFSPVSCRDPHRQNNAVCQHGTCNSARLPVQGTRTFAVLVIVLDHVPSFTMVCYQCDLAAKRIMPRLRSLYLTAKSLSRSGNEQAVSILIRHGHLAEGRENQVNSLGMRLFSGYLNAVLHRP